MINKKHLMVAVVCLIICVLLSFVRGYDEMVSLFYYPLLAITIVGVCTED
jgi:uncharacterized membrane protein YkvI